MIDQAIAYKIGKTWVFQHNRGFQPVLITHPQTRNECRRLAKALGLPLRRASDSPAGPLPTL
jgi:hypothetical protein